MAEDPKPEAESEPDRERPRESFTDGDRDFPLPHESRSWITGAKRKLTTLKFTSDSLPSQDKPQPNPELPQSEPITLSDSQPEPPQPAEKSNVDKAVESIEKRRVQSPEEQNAIISEERTRDRARQSNEQEQTQQGRKGTRYIRQYASLTREQQEKAELLRFMPKQVREEYNKADAHKRKAIWEGNKRAFKAAKKREEQKLARDQKHMEEVLDLLQQVKEWVKEDPSKADLLPPDDASTSDLRKWYQKMQEPQRPIPFPGRVDPAADKSADLEGWEHLLNSPEVRGAAEDLLRQDQALKDVFGSDASGQAELLRQREKMREEDRRRADLRKEEELVARKERLAADERLAERKRELDGITKQPSSPKFTSIGESTFSEPSVLAKFWKLTESNLFWSGGVGMALIALGFRWANAPPKLTVALLFNFVKTHSAVRCTPAMAAGVEKSFLTVGDLIEAAA